MRYLFFFLFFGLQTSYAEDLMANRWLWSAADGFIPAAQCDVLSHPSTDFQVVQYTGSGSQSYENLRTFRGAIQNYLINRSLVRLEAGTPKDHYSFVQVVGVSQTPGIPDNPWYAEALTEGYIHEDSFRPLSEYVFEIKEGAPADLLNEEAVIGSFWQARMLGDRYQYFHCPDGEYLIFDVHLTGTSKPVQQVGVSPLTASILTSIRTYTNQEAELAILSTEEIQNQTAEAQTSTNVRGSVSTNISPVVSTSPVHEESPPEPMIVAEQSAEAESDTVSNNNIQNSTTQMGGAQTSGSAPTASQSETSDNGAADSIDTEIASNSDPQSEWDSIQQIISAEGIPSGREDGLHRLVCTDGVTLNVRSQGNADEVLFRANPYERVIPVQDFEEDESFTSEIGGESYTFIKVAFPDRENEDERFGWVAEEYVTFESHCPSFQRTLGDQQPIICISSGEMNVRSESLDPGAVEFRANQFEPVALFNDSLERKRSTSVNGRVTEFIPVLFPERGNQEGWVASNFVKTKAQCEPYRAGGCCKFPTAQYPQETYTSSAVMTSFDYRRGGGSRRHAGCDLYRQRGDAAVAVAQGEVVRGLYEFYSNTFAIDVKHEDFIARYGEMLGTRASGTSRGSTVRTGQTLGNIARIGSLHPMLHFEMYSDTSKTNTASGREKLTQAGGRYSRRSDLLNPTPHLQNWELKTFGRSH